MKQVLVPLHLFDIHPKCNKYLLSIDPTSDPALYTGEEDGCHGTAQDVAEAKHLIQRLFGENRHERFVMITVEEVPKFKGKVNEEAIKTLVPVIRKYQKKTGR
jgi:hypothetical protein